MDKKFEVCGLINGGTDWYDLGSFDTFGEAEAVVHEEIDGYSDWGIDVWYGDTRIKGFRL